MVSTRAGMKSRPPVPNRGQVLVVGTTSDYIDWIRNSRPGQALFLTDPGIRKEAREEPPQTHEEIICPITDVEGAKKALARHLETWHTPLLGIACFDCESMETASLLARDLGLAYPEPEAIQRSRDKLICKQIWQDQDIACPATRPLNHVRDLIDFLARHPAGVVLKPFCGSGSELVFRCTTPEECQAAFEAVKKGLDRHRHNPLFRQTLSGPYRMLAESLVPGPEYSCDFLMDGTSAAILRKTRKIKRNDLPFGTISGYRLCQGKANETGTLSDLLFRAARSLGIHTGICMVDFIMNDSTPVIIEMTPRPGGDCLPFLIKEAAGLDMLGLTLDAAAGRPWANETLSPGRPLVGMRIHAQRNGTLKWIDTRALSGDRRLKHLHLTRSLGHRVTLPPADYDSWLLGHMILEPDSTTYPETECLLLSQRVHIEMEAP